MVKFSEKIIFSLQMLTLVFLTAVVKAQSPAEMKQIFSQAESYYLYGEYELANPLYILLESPDNQNIKYKIGVCYLNIPGEKEKAVPYLEEAVKNAAYEAKEESFREKRAPLDAYFFLAKAYMINNDLEKGINTFETFKRLAGETKSKGGMQNMEFIGQQIQACNNAIAMQGKPVVFSKKPLGADFAQGSINENPAVSFDGNTMVYTERRGIINVIFFSKKIRGVWQTPVEITSELNAGEDCSSCSLNNDGTELFLYKTDNYDGAIYSSSFVNDAWTPIKKLNKNINTKFYESHAAVSADGKKLYFTSNRDGGQGNLDIYVSEKDATGEWGPAKNLGPSVNTPFNEDTPFITANDSVLYYSSEGHSSIGGFDNFMSKAGDSAWQAPVNLGFPVNTTDDDKFFQPANNGLNAYYSTTTDYKKKDIFYLDFGDIGFDLKGKVTLSDTTLSFDENYVIYLTDRLKGDTLQMGFPETSSGSYSFRIKPGNYSFIYSGNGYFTQKIDTVITSDFPLSEVYLDVTLMRDSSVARPHPAVEYEKINLLNIPIVNEIDSSMLIRNMAVNDITDGVVKDADILYYTVQVIALHNPVDVSYFRYIPDLKVMYDDSDKFYRYTTGTFDRREEAYKWRSELIRKGYPEEIFIKKVSRK